MHGHMFTAIQVLLAKNWPCTLGLYTRASQQYCGPHQQSCSLCVPGMITMHNNSHLLGSMHHLLHACTVFRTCLQTKDSSNNPTLICNPHQRPDGILTRCSRNQLTPCLCSPYEMAEGPVKYTNPNTLLGWWTSETSITGTLLAADDGPAPCILLGRLAEYPADWAEKCQQLLVHGFASQGVHDK